MPECDDTVALFEHGSTHDAHDHQRPATGSSQSNSQGNSSLVSRMLTTTVLSTASQFMWDSVNVPEGFYVAVAFDTPHTAGLFAQSPPFFVQTGQNVSCLATTAIPSSSSSDSPSPTVSPGSEAASSSGASGPKKLSPGALAGTISAVVVGVILLLIAFTYPQWWRHALPRRSRNRRPGGPYYLF
ncbi:hypothetical protein A0H81_04817 [Grifola frondosa]|uniref:Uncharacterized protein n=1 Tax=Grifola frondosa TaxID=5627 RepID=A0A1C7ME39_GRIFR|nr:hypothetical protein A0H81_04817 [Grifola frondosa]